MSGSSATRALPKPAEVCARAVIAGIAVLWALHVLQRTIAAPLIPVIAAAIPAIDPEFTILSATVAPAGAAQAAVIRADLARPTTFAGRTLYPFGADAGEPRGWYQIELTLGGLLQYCALLAIIVLGWPVSGPLELAVRVLLCGPMMAALLFMEAPFTVIGELWAGLRDQYAPGQFCGWLIWSRFLMGGGGLLIAGLMGAAVIGLARTTRRAAPNRV
jgi:hypothetical protein